MPPRTVKRRYKYSIVSRTTGIGIMCELENINHINEDTMWECLVAVNHRFERPYVNNAYALWWWLYDGDYHPEEDRITDFTESYIGREISIENCIINHSEILNGILHTDRLMLYLDKDALIDEMSDTGVHIVEYQDNFYVFQDV